MIRAAVIFLFVVVGATAADLDASRMAGALRVREGYRGVDGRHGELGPWQIRASVWAMHMPGIPFATARQEAPARACALKHIAWLALHLEARGVPATAFNVAAAWNAGLEGYTSGRAPARAYLYAGDVERIYNSLLRGADMPPRNTPGPRFARVMSASSVGGAPFRVCLPSTD